GRLPDALWFSSGVALAISWLSASHKLSDRRQRPSRKSLIHMNKTEQRFRACVYGGKYPSIGPWIFLSSWRQSLGTLRRGGERWRIPVMLVSATILPTMIVRLVVSPPARSPGEVSAIILCVSSA